MRQPDRQREAQQIADRPPVDQRGSEAHRERLNKLQHGQRQQVGQPVDSQCEERRADTERLDDHQCGDDLHGVAGEIRDHQPDRRHKSPCEAPVGIEDRKAEEDQQHAGVKGFEQAHRGQRQHDRQHEQPAKHEQRIGDDPLDVGAVRVVLTHKPRQHVLAERHRQDGDDARYRDAVLHQAVVRRVEGPRQHEEEDEAQPPRDRHPHRHHRGIAEQAPVQ